MDDTDDDLPLNVPMEDRIEPPNDTDDPLDEFPPMSEEDLRERDEIRREERENGDDGRDQ